MSKENAHIYSHCWPWFRPAEHIFAHMCHVFTRIGAPVCMVSKNIIAASAEGSVSTAGAGDDAAAADHVHVQHQHEPEISTSASNMTDDQVDGNNIKRDDDNDGRQKPETKLNLTDQTNLLPTRQVVVVFLGLASCIIVATLDSTIVATALPTIAAAFDAGSVASWIPSATLLTSTAFQPLYGRFSE